MVCILGFLVQTLYNFPYPGFHKHERGLGLREKIKAISAEGGFMVLESHTICHISLYRTPISMFFRGFHLTLFKIWKLSLFLSVLIWGNCCCQITNNVQIHLLNTLLLFEGICGHWNGNFTLRGHLPSNQKSKSTV